MSDEKKTICVVEKGSYSDYGVVGVFSSKENAELIANAINGDGDAYEKATVAEWPLDPAVDELRQGLGIYFVQMQADGSVEWCVRKEVSEYDIRGEVRMWRRSGAPAYRGQGLEDVLWVTAFAKDDKHAVKIANEHRTRMLADGTWHTDVVQR